MYVKCIYFHANHKLKLSFLFTHKINAFVYNTFADTVFRQIYCVILRQTILFIKSYSLTTIIFLIKFIYTTRFMIFILQIWTYDHPWCYLDCLQIVPYNPQKHHPIPADVLPNDSEALFNFFDFSTFRPLAGRSKLLILLNILTFFDFSTFLPLV